MCSSTVRISCCRPAIVNRHSHNVGERRGLDAAALVRKLFVSIRGDILADDLTVVGDTNITNPGSVPLSIAQTVLKASLR